MSDDILKIFFSANCQGLRDKSKRVDVLNYFQTLNCNIICLQDTHLTLKDKNSLNMISGCKCFIGGKKTNSRGVAILLRNNFEYEIKNMEMMTMAT